VVVSGDVNHNQIVDVASPWLNKLPNEAKVKDPNSEEKPYMTPSMMSQRDDEVENVNIGVAYLAPEYNNPLSLTSMIWKEILGDYNANHDGTAHLNTANRQYNQFHSMLGDKPGINLCKVDYHGYQDTGLFISWMHVHELYSLEG
jgi:predicted Zn-dependent peptidase